MVEGVDLLVTTVTHTGGAAPFPDATEMKKGSFAAIVDLAAPWHRSSFSCLDSVIIDDIEQEASLPNKLCEASVVTGDISNLVLREVSRRGSKDDRTAFIFRGHALGDLALYVLAVEKLSNFNSIELLDYADASASFSRL